MTDGAPAARSYGRLMTTHPHPRHHFHVSHWGLATVGLILAGWLMAVLTLEGYAVAAAVLLAATVVAAILVPLAAVFDDEKRLTKR